MTVGKTSFSITKEEIFKRISESQLLCAVFPQITEIPCLISSPLRVDNHPSFSLFMDNKNHIRYKDFSSNESGGIIDLLSHYWGCDYQQTLLKIHKITAGSSCLMVKSQRPRVIPLREAMELKEVEVAIRPWRAYDYEYWASFGITKEWLQYAEVYPISHKIITKKDSSGKAKRYVFSADKYAYCFVERKEGKVSIKIYQPMNTKGFKWCSKMDASVIGLWTKVPEYGDKIIICSSMKDALCVSANLNIPTLCLQGEGYPMSKTAIDELKRRYKKIYISFDTDNAGILDGKKLSEQTGFTNIVPDLGNYKDYSDYYKALTDKTQFQQLKTLFN